MSIETRVAVIAVGFSLWVFVSGIFLIRCLLRLREQAEALIKTDGRLKQLERRFL